MVLAQLRRRAVQLVAFLRQALLPGALIAVLCAASWPSLAVADNYPAQPGRSVSGDGISGDAAKAGLTDKSACATYNAGATYAWSYAPREDASSPCRAAMADWMVTRGDTGYCAIQGLCYAFVPVSFCPYGGAISGSVCTSQTSCTPPQTRDPITGKCGIGRPTKQLGKPDLCIHNPCNGATGTKFQIQPIYTSGTAVPLIEQAYYNTRLPAEAPIGINAYGRGWKSYYGRVVNVLATGVAVVFRTDGRQLSFAPPASGNVYVPDVDVTDRLERLVDGTGNTTGWKYTVAETDSTELYNGSGGLLSIADRAGNTFTLGFSDSSTPTSVAPGPGYLISVSDPWGRTIHFTRDSQNKILTMMDPAGGTYTYSYDAWSNLVAITFPDGAVRQFLYNEPAFTQNTALYSFLTGLLDENGSRFASWGYDTQGRVVSSQHGVGVEKYSLTYTTPEVTTTVTDALGVSRDYSLMGIAGVLKPTVISGPTCPSCGPASVAYDANGNVASRTDWNGNRTNYTYDLARNLETSRTEGLTSSGASTPQTRTISTQWDASFHLPTKVAEPLRITTNVYDADGAQCGARGALCSKTVEATTDVNGLQGFSATTTGTPRTWTYTYNAHGFVLTADGPRIDVSDVTTYTYYADDDPDFGKRGNLATVRNAAGQVMSITAYNAHGQPLTIVDPNGMTTTLTYDARLRLNSRNVGGELTSYDYDAVGQLTKVTLPDGSFLSYTYDAAHRLTGMADNLGNSIAYTLDAMGNRTHEEVRDPVSNLAQTRSRVYSNLNRLFQEIGAQNQTTTYAYDDQGNVTSVTDPLNHVTSNQYDALNRRAQVTDPALGVTKYGYNGLDVLTQVTDPRNLVTGYTVDGLGNLTLQSSPDTGNTASTYDAAGNLLTQTDAKGQVTTYAYDALNRVTSITFQDGSKQTYAYDQGTNAIGRLSSITEADSANNVTAATAYAYDLRGRVTSESHTIAGTQYVTGYSYDSFGRLAALTYPDGRSVTYGFDGLGRVAQINTTKGNESQALVTSVTYHPFGGVKSFIFGNGQAYTRSYDQDGRIASYTLGGETYAIGYDAASRIEFISQTGSPANSNTYGYDTLDRLTSAVTPGTSYSYAYDAVGNRLTKTIGAGTDTYSYSSSSNRIASITPSTGPVRSFVFDANGSTTADGNNTYTYDARGRMTQATSSVGATTYQVNALGQRVRKTNNSTDTVFHYDLHGHLIAETDPGGTVKREIFYLGDMPVAVFQ